MKGHLAFVLAEEAQEALVIRGLEIEELNQRLVAASGLLEASQAFDGHLPELFCGFDRSEFVGPIAYPAACTPQAWASSTPFSLLRTLLGLEPDLPDGRLSMRPDALAEWAGLGIDGLAVGRLRLELDLTAAGPVLTGVPPEVLLEGAVRAP